MQQTRGRRNLIVIFVMALLFTVAMPVTSFGKDRGRRGRRNFDRSDWKCSKFVNCHDARDGRWDNRGPRRGSFDDRFGRRRVREWDRNNFFFRNRRFRDHDFDRDDFWRTRQRRLSFRRDFDRDDFWRTRRNVRRDRW